MLEMLKIDLGISSDAYDSRLSQYLEVAQKEIVRAGVTFPDELTVEDMQLVVIYAAWMWRRRDTAEGMPRMVQYLLHNRIMQQKMSAEE